VTALAAIVGCSPILSAASTAPPTRTARLEGRHPPFSRSKYFAHLSQGVAMAVTCERGAPCANVRMTIDDESVVKVVPAHLVRLHQSYMGIDRLPPSTFLLVGLTPGKTTVHLSSNHGRTTIEVDVSE